MTFVDRARGSGCATASQSAAAATLVAFLVATTAAAQPQRQVWDLGTLEPDKVYPTTATAVNASCKGKHDFQLVVENTPWFRITGPKVLEKIGMGQQKVSKAQVDTRGLAPGRYTGLLKVRCLTCPPPPKCVQDVAEFEIRLQIPTLEKRFDPVPGGKLPPTATRCEVTDIEGRFQPTQGVWQDDPVFGDRPGKQLRQLNPRLLEAELPMVVGRPTTLFGTIRPVGTAAEARRQEIFLRGKANGTRDVPVRIQVKLLQGGAETVLWTSPKPVPIKIGPPCRPGAATPFEVAANVGSGAGEFDVRPGRYLLEAALIDPGGQPTGIRARVVGRALNTKAPRILFRPIYVTPLTANGARTLQRITKKLELESAKGLADWLPLRAGSLVTRTLPVGDAAPAITDRKAVAEIVRRFKPKDRGDLARLLLRQAMIRKFRTPALFGGFDRMMVAMGTADFNKLRTGPAARAVGFTNAKKVSFLDVGIAPFHWLVAHELVHTLPYPWSSPHLKRECGLDYHDKLGREAHGVRLLEAGVRKRALQNGVLPLFGQATRQVPWITQCTYRHLLDVLVAGPPDPPVLLVQGYVGREGGPPDERAGAVLLPAYQFDGIPDLVEASAAEEAAEPGEGLPWAIELLGRGDAVVARYRFAPERRFSDSDEIEPIVSFAYRVPDHEGIEAIRLTGPAGAVDLLRYSANAPEIEILTPENGTALPVDGGLSLTWRGADADGDPLLYTVLHSEGGGPWADLAFETETTSLEVGLDPEKGPHALRVVVTDGARSAEARIDLDR